MRIIWFLLWDQFPVIPLKTLLKLSLKKIIAYFSLRYVKKRGWGYEENDQIQQAEAPNFITAKQINI